MRNQLRDLLLNLHADERGMTTVEYVIVLCLIAVVSVGTWQTFGTQVHEHLTDGADQIDTALGNDE